MKKIIALLFAVFALSLAFSASAGAVTYSNNTLLGTDGWSYLPNAAQLPCSANPFSCYPQFHWRSPCPGKDTAIRVVDANGNELGRTRIPGGSCAWYAQTGGLPYWYRFHFEGRMPTDSGNMANRHEYEWSY